MRFSRLLFLVAGVYGLLVTLPLFVLEGWIGTHTPPPITHGEYFYLFAGVTGAWQVLFLVVSRDPLRYRPLIPVCVLEKIAMLVTVLILVPEGRFPSNLYPPAAIDILLGTLFAFSYLSLGRHQRNPA